MDHVPSCRHNTQRSCRIGRKAQRPSSSPSFSGPSAHTSRPALPRTRRWPAHRKRWTALIAGRGQSIAFPRCRLPVAGVNAVYLIARGRVRILPITRAIRTSGAAAIAVARSIRFRDATGTCSVLVTIAYHATQIQGKSLDEILVPDMIASPVSMGARDRHMHHAVVGGITSIGVPIRVMRTAFHRRREGEAAVRSIAPVLLGGVLIIEKRFGPVVIIAIRGIVVSLSNRLAFMACPHTMTDNPPIISEKQAAEKKERKQADALSPQQHPKRSRQGSRRPTQD